MKYVVIFLLIVLIACNKHLSTERTAYFPKQRNVTSVNADKEKVWVFILAGQSNMAGRGLVQPQDTVPDSRIITLNSNDEIVAAKEPLHLYEPSLTGLDCGLSFAKEIIQHVPNDVQVMMIPTAVGGSSISQWLGDSVHRNVKLYSNFLHLLTTAKQYGIVKAILWHQGEADANEKNIPLYRERLGMLFTKFREASGNNYLPVLIGQLGPFAKYQPNFGRINHEIEQYAATDNYSAVIFTQDLKDRGDSLHFDSKSQRIMGKRFAQKYFEKFIQH